MKKRTIICLLTLAAVNVMARAQDTTIGQVKVGFAYSDEIFPASWRPSPINATGKQIDPAEISRSKSIVANALGKYPDKVLEYNLKAVYILKSMKFFDVGYGGTNSNTAVYLTNDGISLGYTDKYLEQTFHHEFSSILLRGYARFFDSVAWKAANAPGFVYTDRENGVGAIRNNESSQSLDPELSEKGFVAQYARSSIENDVNSIAQNLFCPEKEFWSIVDRFPRVKQKTKLLITFYNQLNPRFTEEWFRKMGN